MKFVNQLSRTDMRKVKGGNYGGTGSCTATCSSLIPGMEFDITCTGSNCTAIDDDCCFADVGANGEQDFKECGYL